MKATDIKPGLAVMVPGNYVKWDDVKNGRRGIPAIVLGFGHFRLTQQGPCGFIAVDNPRDWEPNKVVVLRQVADFWRNDDQPITSDTEWQLALISQHSIIPVAAWETLHAEYALLMLDLDALQSQQTALFLEKKKLIGNDPKLAKAILAVVQGQREKTEYCNINAFRYDNKTTIDFQGRVNIDSLSFETQTRVAELDEQITKVQAKLSCIR